MEDEQGELGPSSDEVRWLTFAELADELCQQYMAMGMTYDEYWHGNYAKLEHYRKSYEIVRERMNHDAWLQGAYIYDAICMVAPILHAFAKPGTKPIPYHKEPYGVSGGDARAADKPAKTVEEIQEIQATNASAKFSSFAAQWNKQFDSKGGDVNGGND